MAMAFHYFESFVSKGLKLCYLNEAICEGFRSYLWSRSVISFRDKPITRNTAANYAAFGGQAPNARAEML